MKENNLMTVKNIFIIVDASNITKYKRKFKKLLLFFNDLETVETNVKDHFPIKAKIDYSHLKLFHVFSNINVNGKISTPTTSSNLNVFNFLKF